MIALSEDLILAALASVQDPSQGQDIVALGMVSGLQIKDSNISFALAVPAHRGPAMEPVRRAAEKAALAQNQEEAAENHHDETNNQANSKQDQNEAQGKTKEISDHPPNNHKWMEKIVENQVWER